jgi:hypothetical protein
MKKNLILLWALSTGFLVAGGNNCSALPDIKSIENSMKSGVCKDNKVYVEKHTKLMWQDEAYVDVEDGAYRRNNSAGKAGSFSHAKTYCSRLFYEGYADWRLPTADELSHVHRKVGQSFTNFRGEHFWSSTPTVGQKYYVVYATDAYQYKRSTNKSNYVRCVRCIDGSL